MHCVTFKLPPTPKPRTTPQGLRNFTRCSMYYYNIICRQLPNNNMKSLIQ